MPGKASKFTPKKDRQAQHVTDSEIAKGMSPKKAKGIGYAVANKTKKKHKKKKKVHTADQMDVAKKMGVKL